ncbi:MAG: STAS domain-containing protein [Pseudomonadota bacterium]
MPDGASVAIDANYVLSGGPLEMDDANQLSQQGRTLIAEDSAEQVVIDMSGLSQANSILIAVLLSWYREAELHDKSLRIINPPTSAEAIISFSGLDEILVS